MKRRTITRRGKAGIAGLALAAVGAFLVGAVVARDSSDEKALASKGPAKVTVKKSMWGLPVVNGRSMFPTYRDLGVGIKSEAVRWDWIVPEERPKDAADPNDPAYTWPKYLTTQVRQADRFGMDFQVMMLGTPKWANGGKSWQWMPDDPGDFRDFTAAISKRYPSVDMWMVWGEPNRAPNFQPLTPAKRSTGPLSEEEQIAPGNYAELLDAAYEGLKGADESDLVIGGNTYTSAGTDDINPYQWIEYLRLPNGDRPRLDLWGHNPFGFQRPVLTDAPSRRGNVAFRDLERLTAKLDEAFPDQPPLKLFLAEWGVPSGFKDLDLGYELSEEEAEDWIKSGFKIAREWDRIYSLGWIHPVDTDRSSMGLLDENGERKPTYDVYKGS